MKHFQANIKALEGADTQVVGVSIDSPFANKAFADSLGVTFPLASDFFNQGAVSKSYGAWLEKYKAARRVTYLIDKNGKIDEIQVDKDAIDPTKIVTACSRKAHKS